MSVYMTGDTHGDFSRFQADAFRQSVQQDDYVIICGDFGGVWDGGAEEARQLDWLNQQPFFTLFVSGNHENFDLLSAYPKEQWHGGSVQRIRPRVLHLLRGQAFDLCGKKFFTMGGASSRLLRILQPNDPLLRIKGGWFSFRKAQYWIEHVNWFRQEVPDEEEYRTARETLERCHWSVDYIVTHCAPTSIQNLLDLREAQAMGSYLPNKLTDFLDEIASRCTFQYWFLGHYHGDAAVKDKFLILYDHILKLE